MPSGSFVFSVYGYELHINDDLVAAVFASLPQPGQNILLLHCVLELTDGEEQRGYGNVPQRRPVAQDKEKRRTWRLSGRCIRRFSIWYVPTHLEWHYGGKWIKNTAPPATMPEKP